MENLLPDNNVMRPENQYYISILDTFGGVVDDDGNLEHLCVNFADELLQFLELDETRTRVEGAKKEKLISEAVANDLLKKLEHDNLTFKIGGGSKISVFKHIQEEKTTPGLMKSICDLNNRYKQVMKDDKNPKNN